MSGLTPKQRAARIAIAVYTTRYGIAPTFQEVADLLGISKIAAYERVQALAAKGALTITPHRHRGITLPTHCPTCGRAYQPQQET